LTRFNGNRFDLVSSLRLHTPPAYAPIHKARRAGLSIFLDSHACRGGQSAQIAIPLEVEYVPTTTASCQPILDGRKVLLIDANQPTRDVRIRVLQSHGVEVRAADSFSGARFLWRPNVYDLILLDVRRHLPGEALEFYEQIKTASPKEHFAFLVGPPVYLS